MKSISQVQIDSGVKLKPYLQNNDLPSHDIIEQVTRAKLTPTQKLQSLERDICALQHVLDTMWQMKDDLEKEIQVYDCILSPIRHLPDDLLEEIFYHCLPWTRNARPFVSEAPLLPTLVCKKWRAISMSAPRLWASLHIPLAFDYHTSLLLKPRPPTRLQYRRSASSQSHPIQSVDPNIVTDLQLQRARQAGLNQWIRRSGTVPLAISLFSDSIFASDNGYYYAPDPSGYETSRRVVRNAEVQETIDLVAQYADRFSSLQVIAPFDILELLGQAIQRSFNFKSLPHLRRIQLSYEGALISRQTNDWPWSSLFFSSATLQDVCLRTQMEVVKDILPSLQASNITTLSLHHAINPTVAQHLLNRLVHLERCHLSIYNSSGPLPPIGAGDMHMALEPITATIHLPCLKELSITSTLADLPNVCGVLGTPSLSKLQLSFTDEVRGFDELGGPPFTDSMADDVSMTSPSHSAERFSVFLSQCSSLRTLIIYPSYVKGANLQSILSHLPQVEHLVIQHFACPPRPGALISTTTKTANDPLKFSLYPLLTQQIISRSDPVNLDQPLLPALTSFSWDQYADDRDIPIQLFVDFVKGRLAVNEIGCQRPTATLCNINIRLLLYPDPDSGIVEGDIVEEIAEEIAEHAESVGLKRGVDYHLNVSSLSSNPLPMLPVVPEYFPRFTNRSMGVSEDNLLHEYDVTWPWIDI